MSNGAPRDSPLKCTLSGAFRNMPSLIETTLEISREFGKERTETARVNVKYETLCDQWKRKLLKRG